MIEAIREIEKGRSKTRAIPRIGLLCRPGGSSSFRSVLSGERIL